MNETVIRPHVEGALYDQGYYSHDLPSDDCIAVEHDADYPELFGRDDFEAAKAVAEALEEANGHAWHVGWHQEPGAIGVQFPIAGDVWVSPEETDGGPHVVTEDDES